MVTNKTPPKKAEELLSDFLNLSPQEQAKVINAMQAFKGAEKDKSSTDESFLYDSLVDTVKEGTGMLLPTYKKMVWTFKDFGESAQSATRWLLYPPDRVWSVKEKAGLFRIAATAAYYVYPPPNGFGRDTTEVAYVLMRRLRIAMECAFPGYRKSLLYPHLALKPLGREEIRKLAQENL